MKAAARRAAGPVSVETQRNWYFEELEQDIGRDPSGNWRYAGPASEHRRGLWSMIAAMILLMALVFAATIAVLMWRDGAFDRWLAAPATATPSGPRQWVLGDQETGRPSPIPTGKAQKSDVPPNEIEPPVRPAPPPSETAAEPEPQGDSAE